MFDSSSATSCFWVLLFFTLLPVLEKFTKSAEPFSSPGYLHLFSISVSKITAPDTGTHWAPQLLPTGLNREDKRQLRISLVSSLSHDIYREVQNVQTWCQWELRGQLGLHTTALPPVIFLHFQKGVWVLVFCGFLGVLLSCIKLMRGRNVTGEEQERETKLPIS